MTVKITKLYEGGETKTDEVDEMYFPMHSDFAQTLQAMIEKKCTTIIVTLEEGLQVLFTLTEKK